MPLTQYSRLTKILFFIGNASALLADVLGVVDKRFELLEVDVTLATGHCT
jgi:hypothetical protein